MGTEVEGGVGARSQQKTEKCERVKVSGEHRAAAAEAGRQRPGRRGGWPVEAAYFLGFAGTPRLPRMTARLGSERLSRSQGPESLKYEGCGQGDLPEKAGRTVARTFPLPTAQTSAGRINSDLLHLRHGA